MRSLNDATLTPKGPGGVYQLAFHVFYSENKLNIRFKLSKEEKYKGTAFRYLGFLLQVLWGMWHYQIICIRLLHSLLFIEINVLVQFSLILEMTYFHRH